MIQKFSITRRSALLSFGVFELAARSTATVAAAQQAVPAPSPNPGIMDAHIFNFALNLESLEGIEVNDRANIVPADADAQAFSRTPQQVLRIVYLADQPGVSAGGLFAKGMNGTLRST